MTGTLRQPVTRQTLIFLFAWAAIIGVLLAACNGGQRPTLVEDPPPTAQPPLELELPPAPVDTPPLPPSEEDFPLQASVDDALIAWAADRQIPYVDSCSLAPPDPATLCDVPTERDTVRLLGPSADEIWYVVTVEQQDSFDFGTGYRVQRIEIAGS